MKRLALMLVCSFTLSSVGCQVTREWVVNEATKIAELAANKALSSVSDRVVPLIDERVRESIDQNNNNIWEQNELKEAIQSQFGVLANNITEELLVDTDKKLDEKLKDAVTKEQGIGTLLVLGVLWLLTKLGFKIKDGKINASELFNKLRGKKEEEEPTL